MLECVARGAFDSCCAVEFDSYCEAEVGIWMGGGRGTLTGSTEA
jgi:hypothetical protein